MYKSRSILQLYRIILESDYNQYSIERLIRLIDFDFSNRLSKLRGSDGLKINRESVYLTLTQPLNEYDSILFLIFFNCYSVQNSI